MNLDEIEINAIFNKIIDNEHTAADLLVLRQALSAGDKPTLKQLGKYITNIEEGKDIHIGDRIYQGTDAETLKAILQDMLQDIHERQKTPARSSAEEELYKRLKLLNESSKLDPRYITCAEYQLFIDERQKLDINQQPDHWKDYKFIPENEKEPIIGIRYNDAKEFCQWLTKWDSQYFKGRYRLPSLFEVKQYPARETDIGCWCDTEESKHEVWGIDKSEIENLRDKIFKILNSYFILDIKNNLELRSIALELLGIGFHAADELAREINLAGIRNIALNHKPTFEDIISNIISDIISGIDLETITKAQDISLSSVYDIASGCNIDLKKDFKNITDFNLELILKYACELDKVFKAEKDIDFNRKIRSIPNANPCRHYLLLVYAIWKLLSVIYEKAVKQVDIFKFPKRRESEKD